MSGEKAEVGHNRRLRLSSTPFPLQTPNVSQAGSFVTPTGLLSQSLLGDDGRRVPPRGHILRLASAGSVALFPSSSFHGKILAFTRQIKNTVVDTVNSIPLPENPT
ncbi:hypothetical protein T05_7890 [Trichinella murrelli]|uniref:Uncharacterized protein n=1 Tax=Trichinella murrelli TaxID=144512 RepID=A0A0V0TD43_9BILA|nr:hypothetical protein T05_7890 [Trichinella murrelli]